MKHTLLIALCSATPALAQDTAEVTLIKSIFETLNPLSIAENREYCGYIGLDDAGNLVASDPTPGDDASCLSDDPVEITVITASYHTHGGYAEDYASELPSADDYEGDEAEGIDGYVATPGGRLWYIDTLDETVSQICGLGCLPSDPNFVPGDLGIIQESYTYDEFIVKLEE